MADKTPREEFDDLDLLRFPGPESEDPPEEKADHHAEWEEIERELASRSRGQSSPSSDSEDALLAAFRTLTGRDEPADEASVRGGRRRGGEKSPPDVPPKRSAADREEAVFAAFSRQARKDPAAPETPETEEGASPEPEPELRIVEELMMSPEPEPPEEHAERVTAPQRRRRPTAQERRDMAERRIVQDPVTIGKRLRSNQMLVYDSELDEVDYTDEDDLPEMRDYLPIRFRRYGRLGLGGGLMYALFVICVSIVLACLAWMLAADVLALNKEVNSAIVTIDEYAPTGDDPVNEIIDGSEVPIQVDIDQVAQALHEAGIIEYPWLFKVYSGFSHANTKIDPGTYDVSTELDYRAIVTALQFGSGNQEITRITFPEGLSMKQIFALLEENHICRVTDLNEAAADYDFDFDFLSDLGTGDPNRLEGYLFPDTYDFYQGEGASIAINRFLRNLNNRITGEMRSQAANRGLSFQELLTMASLIEKEAGSDEERPIMASVINNRLGAGMPLQLDCTLNYIKGTSTFDLTEEDIAIDNPYNTYKYTGLPPGPICCPGLASIEAVLNPEDTDYWYWYSVDGVSTFFTNYDEFNEFARTHPYS